jgi:pyruvate/2-oxoglutarate dehydrogenase complex dihydrolipoamide acyltransferase (E2) component
MPEPIVMPSFGMYTSEGTLINWLEVDGATVQAGQPIAEIETDKAINEMIAPAAGKLQHGAAIGSLIKEEGVIGYIHLDGEEALAKAPAQAAKAAVSARAMKASAPVATLEAVPPGAGFIKASPHARHLARKHGLELSQIRPSGPNGRIVAADVQATIAGEWGSRGAREQQIKGEKLPASHFPPPTSSFPLPAASRKPLTPMRRTIAERLRQSQNTTVALTLTREVEADIFVKARKALGEKLGGSVPYDAIFVKVLADALIEFPALNATIEENELVQFGDISIGFAVSVPEGLLVPVVHQANTVKLKTVAERMRELIAKAKSNALRTEDLSGGTSTITNLGAFGIDSFTPVINPPQASILGIGRIKPRLQVREDGSFYAANTCWLSLTFDHRVADGAPAAQLLDGVARRMNDVDYLWSL